MSGNRKQWERASEDDDLSEMPQRSAVRAAFLRRVTRTFPNLSVDLWPIVEQSSLREVRAAGCQIIRLRVPEGIVDLSGKQAADCGLDRYVKLIWQLRGRARLLAKASDISIADGETAILPLSQSYRLEADADYDALLLVFDAGDRPAWRALAHQWPPRTRKADSATSAARAGIASLIRHADQGRGDALAIEACLDLMAQSLADAADQSPPSWMSHHHLRKAALLVEQRMDDQHYGPDHLAKALGRSRRSLYKDFSELGMAPAAFIRNIRLHRARQEILAESDKGVSLTEIALTCGFADSASFSHAFKKAFGVPPSSLLKQRRNGLESPSRRDGSGIA